MAEILHHLGCIDPVNHGINYPSTGAGFLPSTVVLIPKHLYLTNLTFIKPVFAKINRFSPQHRQNTASTGETPTAPSSTDSLSTAETLQVRALGFQVLDGWPLLGQNETILAYDGDSFPYSLRASQLVGGVRVS